MQDGENTAAWVSARKVRERALAKFLMREGGRARSADEKAKVFVAGFKVRATATWPPSVLARVLFRQPKSLDPARGLISFRRIYTPRSVTYPWSSTGIFLQQSIDLVPRAAETDMAFVLLSDSAASSHSVMWPICTIENSWRTLVFAIRIKIGRNLIPAV